MHTFIKFQVSIIFWMFLFCRCCAVSTFSKALTTAKNGSSKSHNSVGHGDGMIFLNDTVDDYHTQDDDSISKNDDDYTFLIVGGYRPNVHSLAKYTVSLRVGKQRKYFGDNHSCGAVIIRSNVILTAAHCLVSSNSFTTKKISAKYLSVVAGTPIRLKESVGTSIHTVRNYVIHPSYNSKTLMNDIALLFLDDPIKSDGSTREVIQPIDKSPPPNTECTTVGWGRIFMEGPLANDILYVHVRVWKFERCKRVFQIYRGMLCAGDDYDHEKDTCVGDSGGPMFCLNKVAGIVSFGYGCATPGLPGVYTDVAKYYEWIQRTIAEGTNKGCNSLRCLILCLVLVALRYCQWQ